MQTTKGHIHPISQTISEINRIFAELGFVFAEGPERELVKYNFDMLNVPKDHPSRDMQDTFYVSADTVMRTHTSPVQARYMEAHQPPIRIIAPGKVFRNEATDATHEAQFYQLEGLVVDKDISLAHLKGTLEHFIKKLFGDTAEIRFRPSFFPFVEPGVEVDMRLTSEDAPAKLKGKWIEVLGAGMVHPNLLRDAGIDATQYQGFAFGIGIDRIVMLKHAVDDIRHFYSGDLRVVNQF
ncbi:phenylalanine--tRNA ligase subunit alpha [Candidatus Kaiserbacteria bacterium RIFCSPHIGHO2_02_FULL_50_50]|uniref:phenylalanine--tRNA ligase n=1 Tax=Candidatus Kaiserbacteria bacterium RIFCSPHIGHO2_02_FULL_50_50 TaxID=1798492 RepID=A0A1F6DC73_9BACT|nr:MAG: phenylalanine--tRNA ligase subunit alpha [Candidatus Kaiserbacteria bacterium RIFCSPHIGHO2_02_FULL_50_50]OGG88518.1 MAG: phenylalanine--tRNA ligase subunit alpha [Candidatus Kaiserbacteria bacterium RIFCSPLOWO2_12_FULL_50_10]